MSLPVQAACTCNAEGNPESPQHPRTALFFDIELIEEFVARSRRISFSARVNINDQPLTLDKLRPDGEPLAVRIASLDEVGEVLLYNFRDFVVDRRPGIDLVRLEIAELLSEMPASAPLVILTRSCANTRGADGSERDRNGGENSAALWFHLNCLLQSSLSRRGLGDECEEV